MGREITILAAGLLAASAATAQPSPAPPPIATAPAPSSQAAAAPFEAGKPLGPGVKVYGAIVNAESCVYDSERGHILAINRGAQQNEAPNDGFVSRINHDGSVHTARWIGFNRNGLVLNHPYGSDIHAGKLYLSDFDGGTADGAPRTAVLRLFDLATGAPAGEVKVPGAIWLNDIAVARDGTVYGSQTGAVDGSVKMRIYRIRPDGQSSIFLEGAPLARPNGVAIDKDGNIVVVNMEDTKVLTFSPAGGLVRTELSAQSGSDGLVILSDGTKYVSSVLHGGVSRIRPGRPAELIATGIPSAASMCFDSGANQLVIPLNPNNGLAFMKLR